MIILLIGIELFLFGNTSLGDPPEGPHKNQSSYLNPVDIVADDRRAYVALSGTNAIKVLDLPRQRSPSSRDKYEPELWSVNQTPTGLALSPGGDVLAVTMGETNGSVVRFDTQRGAVINRFDVGFSPTSPVLLKRGRKRILAVCNQFTNSVGFYETETGQRIKTLEVTREPISAGATPGGDKLVVGGHLPDQPSTSAMVATAVDIIDLRTFQVRTIQLPNGSSGLKDVAITPYGKYAFATHILAHYQSPPTQVKRGWINANALSVIDLTEGTLLRTVLLDDPTEGAANPWGVGVRPDGRYILVTHAGTHEISRIPLGPLLERVKQQPSSTYRSSSGSSESAPAQKESKRINRNLSLMMEIGRQRISLPGTGPRSLTVSGTRALTSEYFSGSVSIVDTKKKEEHLSPRQISLGEQPRMNLSRRGELRFHNAVPCFQNWQSCASCHHDGRVDGFNWDNPKDGLGNPKQTKNLVHADQTPPSGALGVFENAHSIVRDDIPLFQMARARPEDVKAIVAYLGTLEPVSSPYLEDGQFTSKARRGRELFQREGCAQCHSGALFTDRKSHPIRHARGPDEGRRFDTPSLIELWRTAPYLYDGRARTIEEAIRIHRPETTRKLSGKELEALVEYVLSL